jgi:hypothetical protein
MPIKPVSVLGAKVLSQVLDCDQLISLERQLSLRIAANQASPLGLEVARELRFPELASHVSSRSILRISFPIADPYQPVLGEICWAPAMAEGDVLWNPALAVLGYRVY